MNAKRKFCDNALRGCIYFCAGATVVLLAALILYIFYRGLPNLTWQLVSTQRSVLEGTIGILPNIIFTFYIILTTLVIALPIGIGAAVYLTEYAENKRLVAIIEFATETLTGIPSIIYGLVGMMIFVQGMKMKSSLLAGSLTLVVMVLPNIIRTTEESLKTVPNSYREGAVGLGASKWHTIRTIVLPCTLDGIVSGAILSVGRIVGESAALIYTAGMGYKLVASYFKALHTSGGTLSVMLYQYVNDQAAYDVGFAIAAILMIIVLIINFSAMFVRKKYKR